MTDKTKLINCDGMPVGITAFEKLGSSGQAKIYGYLVNDDTLLISDIKFIEPIIIRRGDDWEFSVKLNNALTVKDDTL